MIFGRMLMIEAVLFGTGTLAVIILIGVQIVGAQGLETVPSRDYARDLVNGSAKRSTGTYESIDGKQQTYLVLTDVGAFLGAEGAPTWLTIGSPEADYDAVATRLELWAAALRQITPTVGEGEGEGEGEIDPCVALREALAGVVATLQAAPYSRDTDEDGVDDQHGAFFDNADITAWEQLTTQ